MIFVQEFLRIDTWVCTKPDRVIRARYDFSTSGVFVHCAENGGVVGNRQERVGISVSE